MLTQAPLSSGNTHARASVQQQLPCCCLQVADGLPALCLHLAQFLQGAEQQNPSLWHADGLFAAVLQVPLNDPTLLFTNAGMETAQNTLANGMVLMC